MYLFIFRFCFTKLYNRYCYLLEMLHIFLKTWFLRSFAEYLHCFYKHICRRVMLRLVNCGFKRYVYIQVLVRLDNTVEEKPDEK